MPYNLGGIEQLLVKFYFFIIFRNFLRLRKNLNEVFSANAPSAERR